MYTFSSKLKTFSIALIILGVLGIGYGFYSAPKTTEDIKEMMAHAGDHGNSADHDVQSEKSGSEDADASHAVSGDSHDAHADEEAHLEHALTQAQNRPWAAVYI
ncbi:MAG: quinol:cytochrome C oxidoreductase, partial [Bacteroidia bacterium]|nr:quinol:cytochrome C oxidoreductase [Bacteroidia bacterium]